VPERLGIPQFSIMLVAPDGKLEVKSAYPSGQGTEGLVFEIGEGACGRAAQIKEPIYIADLAADTSIYRVRAEGLGRAMGSLLAVPMVHRDSLLGVLNFERPEKDGFLAEELEFLSAVADQAAMAVKNARLHEQTVELSITDPLTGVPNRRHLFARLEMEIARANRFGNQVSFLMVDIDHFKHLNDAAGHRAGDQVLRQVCDLMRVQVRRVDTLARYGGEEFVLILPQVTKAEALEVAEKLRRAVEEAPLEHGRVQPGGHVTISVGVANLPVDSTEQNRLVDCADSALYASKRGGRNRVTGYAPGMELHPGRERGPRAVKPEGPAATTPSGAEVARG
jgi:diguanylate cyclase (GGDEF)-like protein